MSKAHIKINLIGKQKIKDFLLSKHPSFASQLVYLTEELLDGYVKHAEDCYETNGGKALVRVIRHNFPRHFANRIIAELVLSVKDIEITHDSFISEVKKSVRDSLHKEIWKTIPEKNELHDD